MRYNKQIKSLAFAVAALAAGSANAALISQWSVYVDTTFDENSIVDSNGNTPGGVTISNADRRLRWGNDGESGLDITNSPVNTVVNTGVLPTVYPPVPNVSVTHMNNPIQPPTLDSVDLVNLVTLTPITPPGLGLPSISLTFLIDFQETTNNLNPCPNGGPNGSGVNVDGCGDIFVIGSNALNYSFFYDTDGAGGDDAQEYFLSFVEATSGLNSLPTAACLAATGSNAPCLGFVTPEKASTTFQFGALITTEKVIIVPPPENDVPEPGILSLVGLALATLGGMRRRRTA